MGADLYEKGRSLPHDTPRLFQITDRGQSALAQKPARIDGKFLDQYPEFREFKALRK